MRRRRQNRHHQHHQYHISIIIIVSSSITFAGSTCFDIGAHAKSLFAAAPGTTRTEQNRTLLLLLGDVAADIACRGRGADQQIVCVPAGKVAAAAVTTRDCTQCAFKKKGAILATKRQIFGCALELQARRRGDWRQGSEVFMHTDEVGRWDGDCCGCGDAAVGRKLTFTPVVRVGICLSITDGMDGWIPSKRCALTDDDLCGFNVVRFLGGGSFFFLPFFFRILCVAAGVDGWADGHGICARASDRAWTPEGEERDKRDAGTGRREKEGWGGQSCN